MKRRSIIGTVYAAIIMGLMTMNLLTALEVMDIAPNIKKITFTGTLATLPSLWPSVRITHDKLQPSRVTISESYVASPEAARPLYFSQSINVDELRTTPDTAIKIHLKSPYATLDEDCHWFVSHTTYLRPRIFIGYDSNCIKPVASSEATELRFEVK